MAQYVVHLAGDLLAGSHLGLLRLQPGHGLGAVSTVAEGLQELPAGPQVEAPAGQGDVDQDRPEGDFLGCLGLLPDLDVDEQADQVEAEDQRGRPERPVDRHGEDDEQAGDPGRVRERPDQRRDHRKLYRPPPPNPERQAQRHPDPEVEGEQFPRDRVGLAVVVQEEAAEHRDEKAEAVDRPVPGAASRPIGTDHEVEDSQTSALPGPVRGVRIPKSCRVETLVRVGFRHESARSHRHRPGPPGHHRRRHRGAGADRRQPRGLHDDAAARPFRDDDRLLRAVRRGAGGARAAARGTGHHGPRDGSRTRPRADRSAVPAERARRRPAGHRVRRDPDDRERRRYDHRPDHPAERRAVRTDRRGRAAGGAELGMLQRALEITAEELGVGVTLRPAESDDL